jgi:ABC-type nickel/cobalt efflux system permease component RcnA
MFAATVKSCAARDSMPSLANWKSGVLAVVLLGFLLGVRHALEADHVAAVTTLASRSASLADRVKLAAAWSSGHATSLLALGATLIALDTTLPERMARALEIVAAVVLIGLGIDVLRRARRRRIHVHVHQHGDGARHVHVHSHANESRHDPAAHEHDHARRLLPRALAVGGIHGLAGSGAVVLLSVQALGSGLWALAYVVCFAIGSILGMVAFTVVLSLPLTVSPPLVERAAAKLEPALGVASIAIGGWMAVQAAAF